MLPLFRRTRPNHRRKNQACKSPISAHVEHLEGRQMLSAVAGFSLDEASDPLKQAGPAEAAATAPGGLVVDPTVEHSSRILVQFQRDLNPAQLKAKGLPAGTTLGAGFGIAPGLHEVHLGRGITVEKALTAFRARKDVLFAEPDFRVEALVTPNDPGMGHLWGLSKIQAPTAWDTTTGAPGTIVAVIDSGVDYTHPDLRANMWVNPGEIAGDGFDNDGNGYVDDVHGYDFAYGDGNPMDDNGHGTHVAGTIGAVGNNGTGVVGVNWSTRIMALKFLDSAGGGYTSNAVRALDYAVANGARISNNSWGGGGYSTSLYTAINNARIAGHVFIAAAGNEGRNNDSTPNYPASYGLDNIVSVAATDRYDKLASFSNYGATSVDLGAPGVDIVSTAPGGYATMSGTSMAAPHVSGVAALVWGEHPEWSYTQVIDRVLSTGDSVAALASTTVTGKRLNAAAAVASSNRAPVAGDDSATVPEDSYVDVAVLANDGDPDGNPLAVSSFTQGANGTVATASSGRLRYTPKANYFGSDSFTYTVSDGKGGTDTATVTVTVSAVNDPPTANDDAYSVTQGTGTTRFDVLKNDSILPDSGETLTITAAGPGSAGGTVVIAGGTAIDYTPKTGFAGTEAFTYTISDGKGGTDTATVSVSVASATTSAYRFDFGTSGSPLASGYTRVTETTRYSSSLGHGWSNGTILSRDRASGTELTRDFNGTSDGTFAVDLASGTYSTTITFGDALATQDQMGVYLEGVLVDTITATAGQPVTRTYSVAVTDGQLSFRLRDLGGTGPTSVVNALEARLTDSSDTQGAQVIAPESASALQGPVDRVVLTFSEAVQDGTFTTADAMLSGPSGAIAISAVNKLSSTQYEVVFASQSTAGTYQLTAGPDIRDLAGNWMDQNGNGTNGEPGDAYVMSFTVDSPSSAAYRFDFGTSSSPLASGYTRVTETTRYSSSLGHGWSNGTILSRDRASGTELTRDFNGTSDGTFAVDLASDTYNVTITFGDALATQDQMGVYLEGVLVDTITATAGQPVTRTYNVAVTDGQLSFRLRDLGGTGPTSVVNALEITGSTAAGQFSAGEDIHGLDQLFSDLEDDLMADALRLAV